MKEIKVCVLQTRATETEKQALKALARLENSNVSAVLRNLIRTAAIERGLLDNNNGGGGND